ncbi:MAG: 23S rRNA (adenine(2503)-C(2))-methyltransferase RlmN, partial [Alistipes sp.]|nr:23S rRNA (adenine(2503)-C(2))-methyltransferase RlmN [Alistipes sp.]
MATLKPLFGLTLNQLRNLCAELELPRFAAGQIARWLYEKRVESVEAMTDLSIKNRAKLQEQFEVGRRAPEAVSTSKDGTKKYLFRTSQ